MAAKGHPGKESVTKRLDKLQEHIETGGIPGPKEFRFLEYYEPKAILDKCMFLSPLWECRRGLMEQCKHRVEWERGENTCKEYIERTGK